MRRGRGRKTNLRPEGKKETKIGVGECDCQRRIKFLKVRYVSVGVGVRRRPSNSEEVKRKGARNGHETRGQKAARGR